MKNSLSPEWNILAPIPFYISFHNRFLHSLLRSTFSLSLSLHVFSFLYPPKSPSPSLSYSSPLSSFFLFFFPRLFFFFSLGLRHREGTFLMISMYIQSYFFLRERESFYIIVFIASFSSMLCSYIHSLFNNTGHVFDEMFLPKPSMM